MNYKNLNRYAFNSLIFGIIYAVIFRFIYPISGMELIRLAAVLVLVLFVLTVAVDLIVQYIKKRFKK